MERYGRFLAGAFLQVRNLAYDADDKQGKKQRKHGRDGYHHPGRAMIGGYAEGLQIGQDEKMDQINPVTSFGNQENNFFHVFDADILERAEQGYGGQKDKDGIVIHEDRVDFVRISEKERMICDDQHRGEGDIEQ